MPGWIPNWGWSSADLARILSGNKSLDNSDLTVHMHHAHGVLLPACQFWHLLATATFLMQGDSGYFALLSRIPYPFSFLVLLTYW